MERRLFRLFRIDFSAPKLHTVGPYSIQESRTGLDVIIGYPGGYEFVYRCDQEGLVLSYDHDMVMKFLEVLRANMILDDMVDASG